MLPPFSRPLHLCEIVRALFAQILARQFRGQLFGQYSLANALRLRPHTADRAQSSAPAGLWFRRRSAWTGASRTAAVLV